MRGVRDRIEDDDELSGYLQGQVGFLARRQFERLNYDLFDEFLELVTLRQLEPRAPEHLPHVVPHRQRFRMMRSDAARERTYRKCDLDHFVEIRLISRGAQGTRISCLVYCLQGCVGV